MTTARARARTSQLSHAVGGGTISRTRLPGGLRVVTEAMPAVRSASVGIWVPVGSRDETPSLAGTSHFLEHLLFKGTAHRSAMDIAVAMDAVGGEFNAFTEKEHTCFYAGVLDRDMSLAVDIVSDVVLYATIAAADVDVERGVVLEEIAMRDDDPADLVHDEFATALFGDVPLGRPILGSTGSIERLTRTQVNGYYRSRYRPSDMVVAVAGNIEHAAVVKAVRRAFGPLVDGDAYPRPAASTTGRRAVGRAAAERPPRTHRVAGRRAAVIAQDTEQANIVLGGHGLHRHDERRFALGVLSAALGGGMSSRLFQRVREERGLAYSVYSFTGSFRDAGQFGVYAGCQPGKADEVINLMVSELDAVAAGALTAAEVERGKGQMRGGFVLSLEDAGSRMTRLGKSELCYGDIMGVDEVLARVDAVTTDDVAQIAADVLSRPRCLTVVGPFGEHDFDDAI